MTPAQSKIRIHQSRAATLRTMMLMLELRAMREPVKAMAGGV